MNQRKDGRWQKNIRIAGKQYCAVRNTPEEVLEAIEELRGKHTRSKELLTLHDVAMNVWHPRITNLSSATISRYESAYIMYIRETLGRKPIKDITMPMVQNWVNELQKKQVSRSGKGKEKQPIGAATVRFTYSVLVQIMRCAEWSDIIIKSPCNQLITLPEIDHKDPKVFTLEDAATLVENAPDRFKLPFFFGLFLGMRLGEVCGLMWDDLDRQGMSITIKRQIDGKGKVSTPKTRRSIRTIPLTQEMIDFIDEHGDLDSRFMIGMNRRALERGSKDHLPKGTTFHDLRAGAASLIVSITRSNKTAADMLGHTTETMTNRHYLGRMSEGMKEASRGLASGLTSKKEKI